MRAFIHCLKNTVLIVLLFFCVLNGMAQQPVHFNGTVINTLGEHVKRATVSIPALKETIITDQNGQFSLKDIPSGTYKLSISYVGYKELTTTISVGPTKKSQTFTIETDNGQLDDVIVQGETSTQHIQRQPIKAEVINTKVIQEQPSTLVELMNRSAGIRVRQSGGLGSNTNLMVNGFQDRSVRFFKDGIPMDYLGAGFNISLVPVNMLERVEVYKGVLPASLGADALGGALNMVTKQSYDKYLEASYEAASFNTHRVSLSTFYKDDNRKVFGGIDAFYNYSDNDYRVDVKITDPELGTLSDANVRLFHNRFRNYYAEVYGGVRDTKWADELRLGITAFHIDRQNQFGTRMSQPFGAASSRQYAFIPTLRYQKTLLNDKLHIDQFLVANTLHVNQVDTAKGQYNWHGDFIPSSSRRGELSTRGSLSDIDYSYYTSRSNVSYLIHPQHRLDLNAVFTGFSRVGNDPLGLRFFSTGKDVLSEPARYDKIIVALGLESDFFQKRLVNNIIVKHYGYTTDATDADWEGKEINSSNKNSKWGVAEAIKFTLNSYSFIRGSVETALRLPEQDELFGDGNLKLSNFALKPERSTNMNLGYRLEKPAKYALEFNSFYRLTEDLILSVPYNFMFSRSENVDKVKGMGFEGDATFTLLNWLKANGNFTYQSLRLFDTDNPTTEGARLRNTPYFFANLGLNASFNKILNSQDKLQVYWYYRFVREYYLDNIPKNKEPDGFLGLWGKAQFDAPNIIPNQQVHSAGLTYAPFTNGLSFGLQVKNLFDTSVYDNFKVQNAGRSFHFKLNYNIR